MRRHADVAQIATILAALADVTFQDVRLPESVWNEMLDAAGVPDKRKTDALGD